MQKICKFYANGSLFNKKVSIFIKRKKTDGGRTDGYHKIKKMLIVIKIIIQNR